VTDLLVRMGYGGNRAEAARSISRTGDERIVLIDGHRLAALMFKHDVAFHRRGRTS
jgi:restriction endonuclease Mrr